MKEPKILRIEVSELKPISEPLQIVKRLSKEIHGSMLFAHMVYVNGIMVKNRFGDLENA